MEKARAIETASAWVGNLVATLLARETATAAVSALVRVAEVRQKTRRDANSFRAKSRHAIDDATRRDPTRLCAILDPRRVGDVSLMIQHFPCQDSDALLFVERRVETLSSAAFLLRDEEQKFCGGGWFLVSVSISGFRVFPLVGD
jgi:hypothetical protein